LSVRPEKVTFVQSLVLVLMRWVVGWHLAVEGWGKLDDPKWTAKEYLLGSTGPLAEYFQQIANNEEWLLWADLANQWGLLLIGVCSDRTPELPFSHPATPVANCRSDAKRIARGKSRPKTR